MTILIRTLIALCFVPAVAIAQQPASSEATPQMSQRDAGLSAKLTGSTLNGYFTITGRAEGDQEPKLRGERYDLLEVRPIDDEGHWLFKARIRYGANDVTVPLTLPVEWAGDTPVIVVDNMGIPGLGTYSARVLFHDGHYAGHWSGGDHGGNLFGTIERTEPAADSTNAPPTE